MIKRRRKKNNYKGRGADAGAHNVNGQLETVSTLLTLNDVMSFLVHMDPGAADPLIKQASDRAARRGSARQHISSCRPVDRSMLVDETRHEMAQ